MKSHLIQAGPQHACLCYVRIQSARVVLNLKPSQKSLVLPSEQSCPGPSAKASEEDQERTRRLADAEMHRHHLESLLDQRDREITALREVTSSMSIADGPCHYLKDQSEKY